MNGLKAMGLEDRDLGMVVGTVIGMVGYERHGLV